MAHIVSVKAKISGAEYFLRHSIWTSDRERADLFPSKQEAEKAFAKSMRFSNPRKFAQLYTAPEISEA
jgi:hypothetical protein